MAETRRRAGELICQAFAILLPHQNGLPIKEVLARIEQSDLLTEEERELHPSKVLFRRFEVTTHFAAIAPLKANWLRNEQERWTLTERGRRAYEQFADPEQFLLAAARLSTRGWLAIHVPRFYSGLTRVAYQLLIEYRLVRRVGLAQLFGTTFRSSSGWQEVLPLQTPRRFILSELDSPTVEGFFAHLQAVDGINTTGGHAVYLAPAVMAAGVCASLAKQYPADAALKIIKTPGNVDTSSYVHEAHREVSSLHKLMIHSHRHLSLVANLLYACEVGPRLYDLIELQSGNNVFTAYVVAHVSGQTPSQPECEEGIRRLRELEAQGLIKVTMPDGYDDEDFQCPSCNNNAFVDNAGRFQYVDFQNFLLTGYETYLRNVAIAAAAESHFGDVSLLRGGAYLYQSVPGVNLQSKRDVQARMTLLKRLLEEANVSVNERLVLDVGCNIGMMMAQYLKLGARWCHGWDRPGIVGHADRLLLALGCTRFTLSAGELNPARALIEDLPEFLRPELPGCVVSYLAVRGYFGWLPSLKSIPWSALIYEGHESDTPEDFDNYITELRKLVPCRLAASSTYEDGDSESRFVAVIVREPQVLK